MGINCIIQHLDSELKRFFLAEALYPCLKLPKYLPQVLVLPLYNAYYVAAFKSGQDQLDRGQLVLNDEQNWSGLCACISMQFGRVTNITHIPHLLTRSKTFWALSPGKNAVVWKLVCLLTQCSTVILLMDIRTYSRPWFNSIYFLG